jgi:DNA-binding NarL/FixJ family response regulator
MERWRESITERSEPQRPLVRVLLVDDQQLVRAGLRSLLSAEQDIIVVGEAGCVEAALDLCARTQPDLLLVDAMLPKMGTPSLIREVRTRYTATQVLAIAECAETPCSALQDGGMATRHCLLAQNGHEPPEDCLEMALTAGARGVIRKTCSPEELLRAIRSVAPGRYWTDLATALRILERVRHPDWMAGESERSEGLTRREVEVVRELIAGHSNKQISRTLGISEQSAKNLVSRVLTKLGLESRVQVAVYAVNTRLLERYDSLFGSHP